MKVNTEKKAEIAKKLNHIASNVAKKPVYVISRMNGNYNIVNYYNNNSVIRYIPSKSLAQYMCDAFNKKKTNKCFRSIQQYVDTYSKHYYDCEFYKHTINTTNDEFKRSVTITRLDISIEYLKQAANQIRKSC